MIEGFRTATTISARFIFEIVELAFPQRIVEIEGEELDIRRTEALLKELTYKTQSYLIICRFSGSESFSFLNYNLLSGPDEPDPLDKMDGAIEHWFYCKNLRELARGYICL